jgi:hypothetical protein
MTRPRLVLPGLIALTTCLAGLLAIVVAGIVSGGIRTLCLVTACALFGLIVVLTPSGFRKSTKVVGFAGAFVAAAGLLSVFLPSDDGQRSASHEEPSVNAEFLAVLVRRGPFTGQLPTPPEGGQLRARSIEDVEIGDPSASGRLDAVQVIIDSPHGSSVFAEIEIYPTPAAAAKRKAARIKQMVSQYGSENVYDNCTDETGTHGAGWTCVDARGNAYAEAAVFPSDNAHIPVATGTVASLLRYTDLLTRVAGAREASN